VQREALRGGEVEALRRRPAGAREGHDGEDQKRNGKTRENGGAFGGGAGCRLHCGETISLSMPVSA